jgi:NNP family nitrate/nitrite transporter-like MFS transporter
VGAGGNIGGMTMGFLFKNPNITYSTAFFYIGGMAIVAALIIAVTKFGKVPVKVDKSLKVNDLKPA